MEHRADDVVPVAFFSNEIEAELAQATLAAAGIESYLKYEDTGDDLAGRGHEPDQVPEQRGPEQPAA